MARTRWQQAACSRGQIIAHPEQVNGPFMKNAVFAETLTLSVGRICLVYCISPSVVVHAMKRSLAPMGQGRPSNCFGPGLNLHMGEGEMHSVECSKHASGTAASHLCLPEDAIGPPIIALARALPAGEGLDGRGNQHASLHSGAEQFHAGDCRRAPPYASRAAAQPRIERSHRLDRACP